MPKSHTNEGFSMKDSVAPKRIKLFEGLTDNEVTEIMRHGNSLDFRAGDAIFHKGQLGNTIFIVLGGTVNIVLDNHIISKCRMGDAFGEMSALNHRPHCANADAATAVKLFTLNEDQIVHLLEKRVGIRLLLNIIHMLSGYLENSNHINAKNTRVLEVLKKNACVPTDFE